MINQQTRWLVINVNLVFNYISISFWVNPYISVRENFWFVNILFKVPFVIIFPIFYNYILTRVDIFNISILIFYIILNIFLVLFKIPCFSFQLFLYKFRICWSANFDYTIFNKIFYTC